MRHHRKFALIALALVLACAMNTQAQNAAPASDIWMSVTLQGRKIGSMHQTRTVEGNRVTSAQMLDVTLDRAGIALHVTQSERAVETRDGEPLAFSARTDMPGSESSLDGKRLPDGRFGIVRTAGGATRTETLDWPAGAKLDEGQRLAELAAGAAPDTRYRVTGFDPSSTQVLTMDNTVVGMETIDLPGGAQRLLHTRSKVDMADGGEYAGEVWADAHADARRMTMPLLGMDLELIACDKACATAPDQSVDLLTSTVAESPRALPPMQRDGMLDYTMSVRGDPKAPFANTDEQQARALGGGRWTVRIGPSAANASLATPEAPPTAADIAANEWLQADAPAIRELALRTAGPIRGADARMRALAEFVRSYITEKDLSVGYGSALDTLKSREGDCTEHAVLLAALARALGIPARIAVGLAYAPGFPGHAQSFVPHMWVQAWIGDRWQSYDAALGQFDAGHIALGVGDGDPWRFYAGLTTLGNLRIEAVRSR